MRFHIQHTSRYTYSKPVFLEPHRLLLRPRCDGWQSLESFTLRLQPEPAGCSMGIDAEGNSYAQCWFEGVTDHFEIETEAVVRTMLDNPYGFLLETQAQKLPLSLSQNLQQVLAPAMVRAVPEPEDDPVKLFAENILAAAENQTMRFCAGLLDAISADFENVVRHEEGIHTPATTLQKRSGACRDLAVLFVDACRAVGLPARFVSGYQDPDLPEDTRSQAHELHAWAEAFIPGGGWRGFDPSCGLAVAEQHIALAASCMPELAMPLSGSFRGTDATSTQEHVVNLSRLEG